MQTPCSPRIIAAPGRDRWFTPEFSALPAGKKRSGARQGKKRLGIFGDKALAPDLFNRDAMLILAVMVVLLQTGANIEILAALGYLLLFP